MARRRQEKDERKFEADCSYCGAGVKANALRCPSCKRWFSSGKKLVAVVVAIAVLLASLSFLVYYYVGPGHDAWGGDGYIPDGGDGTTEKKVMVITTTRGAIKVELDLENAPRTSGHMISLVNNGVFGAGSASFYRAEPGFVIQGGLRTGSDTTVAWEDTGLLNKRYTISMARSGDPNTEADSGTGSSEFFINLADNANLDSYTYKYVVFGKVVDGYNIVDLIASLPTQQESGIRMLTEPVAISNVLIING